VASLHRGGFRTPIILRCLGIAQLRRCAAEPAKLFIMSSYRSQLSQLSQQLVAPPVRYQLASTYDLPHL
jgi:hypothetical protein